MSFKDNFNNLITFFQSKFSNNSPAGLTPQDNSTSDNLDDLASWESALYVTKT